MPKLELSFASIATKLGIPQSELMGRSRKYELVKEWLETTGKPPNTTFRVQLLTQGRENLAPSF